MKYLKRLWVNIQLISYVFWRHIAATGLIGPWLLLTGFIIFVLQWLFNFEQLVNIVTDSGLNLGEIVEFLGEGFVNIFRYADDIVPISIILIGATQATAIVLLLKLRQVRKKAIKAQVASLGIGLIGSGCVACGGSVLTPLLGAIASNVSLTLAERLSDFLLIIAVLLSYRALSKITMVYAHEVAKVT